MKLLLDRMLSERLEQMLQTHYPDTQHADRFLDPKAEDTEIWEFAKQNNFTIVTKDSDFRLLAVRLGSPPKLIKLNIGNCSNEEAAELLISNKQEILDLREDDHPGPLELWPRTS